MPYNNYSSSDLQKLDPTFTSSSNSQSGDLSIRPTVSEQGQAVSGPIIDEAGRVTGYTSQGAQSSSQPGSSSSVPGSQLTYSQPLPQGSTESVPSNGVQTNPTSINQSTQTFGQDSAGQFMIQPFMQPFPLDQQKAENAAFRDRFGNYLAQTETPEATRARFENRYGYRDAQENYFRTQEAASDVMNSIRANAENVQQRANNSGQVISQSQLDRISNTEVKGLMETYSRLGELNEQQGRRLAMIEQNMNQAAQLEMAQQQKMMTPWLQEYQDNQIMQAREYSGWTFANQLELNRLMANQQAGFNWTNAEANRAQELAVIEKQFENQLKLMEKSNEMDWSYFS